MLALVTNHNLQLGDFLKDKVFYLDYRIGYELLL